MLTKKAIQATIRQDLTLSTGRCLNQSEKFLLCHKNNVFVINSGKDERDKSKLLRIAAQLLHARLFLKLRIIPPQTSVERRPQ
jgi:uncharacterized protein YydD (DUF2326 family)